MFNDIMLDIFGFLVISFAGIMLWGVIYSDPEPLNLFKKN